MVELKNISAGTVAEPRLFVRRQGKEILTVENDFPRCWSIKSTHKMQESALA